MHCDNLTGTFMTGNALGDFLHLESEGFPLIVEKGLVGCTKTSPIDFHLDKVRVTTLYLMFLSCRHTHEDLTCTWLLWDIDSFYRSRCIVAFTLLHGGLLFLRKIAHCKYILYCCCVVLKIFPLDLIQDPFLIVV